VFGSLAPVGAAKKALDNFVSQGYYLLPSVRGDLLAKLSRWGEVHLEFKRPVIDLTL
jgi:predicted RNA polymerase sigma factor